jgi:hypothetical protein
MKTIALVLGSLALASLAAVSVVNAQEPATAPDTTAPADDAPRAIPTTPAAVDDIVYARKFTLRESYKFRWCKEKPNITSGYLLVLKVNPDLVLPRQVAEPVLYVGDQTAERLNNGYHSGHVVALAPGAPDLTKALMWFGTPELPERVDAEMAKAELGLAKAAGIKPFSAKAIKAALAQGGKDLTGSNVVDVLRVAADLIKRYSPAEEERARTLVPESDPAKD